MTATKFHHNVNVSLFSGLRDRSAATAWLDDSTASCNFSSIIAAVNDQTVDAGCLIYDYFIAESSGKVISLLTA